MAGQPDYQYQEPYGGLISADFIPNCIKPGGLLSWAEFERFPVVIQRANEWLRKNPTMEVRTCETVEFNTENSGAVVNVVESVYTTRGEGANRYVRGLRLWIQPRRDGQHVPQQIAYFNVMPTIRSGFFTTEASDRLDSLIYKTNNLFASNPIQGKIVTIETVTLKVSQDTPDPDCTSWTERGAQRQVFAYMLRIFYVQGPPAMESIGVADFVPAVLDGGGVFSRPVLEPFPQVLGKASNWLVQQAPQLRMLNVQTLLFKQKWTTTMDTLQMLYTENDLHTYYVRYIRLAYVVPMGVVLPHATSHGFGLGASGQVRLNCKLFVPGMLEPPACCTVGTYENQIQIRERMSEWMRATGARVIAVETIPMRIFSGAEAVEGFDTMHTWNRVVTNTHAANTNTNTHHNHHNHDHHNHTHEERASETHLILYRAYVDGAYPEPFGTPQLPSVEEYMRNNSGCTIL